MNPLARTLVLLTLAATPAFGIPQDFAGFGVFGGGGPVINMNVTPGLLDPGNWNGDGANLPGEWEETPSLEGETVRHMTQRPFVFGKTIWGARSVARNGKLESISVNFIDAGAFFGYNPGGSASKEQVVPLKEKQRLFKKLYRELEKDLPKTLTSVAKKRGSETKVGRTAFLRSNYLDYPYGDFVLRLAANTNHSINVHIMKKDSIRSSYLAPELDDASVKERRVALAKGLKRAENGDVMIEGVPIFEQGLRPYCAISTLAMVMHHFGLRLTADDLAAGARLKNTGSAAGSKMVELYAAAADEAELRVMRSGSFDFKRAKRAIDDGFPVIVWRRYDRARNQAHMKYSFALARNPDTPPLPAPDSEERASWPGKEAPGHASIITGYNEKRGEIIFMESWGEQARDRRMRIEEMEGTSYMAFYYKL